MGTIDLLVSIYGDNVVAHLRRRGSDSSATRPFTPGAQEISDTIATAAHHAKDAIELTSRDVRLRIWISDCNLPWQMRRLETAPRLRAPGSFQAADRELRLPVCPGLRDNRSAQEVFLPVAAA
jgi:hypothetical protein